VSLQDDLAELVLTPGELARWRVTREFDIPIMMMGGPETHFDRMQMEARELNERVVVRTVAAVQDGRLRASGVPAGDPLAAAQPLSASVLARAVREHVYNLDLVGRRLLRGHPPLAVMIDLEIGAVETSRAGAPGYEAEDAGLFPEMTEMIRAGSAKSAHGAALRLALDGRVSGGGNPESLAKRLAGRFRKWREEFPE
jgi:hypothetical protein